MKEYLKNFNWLLRLKFIGGLFVLLTLLSLLASFHRYFEMLNSFVVYFFYFLLFSAIPFFIKKQWLFGVVFISFAMLNLSKFIHLYFTPGQDSVAETEKVFVLNVFTANKSHDKVIELIRKENPDHITLTEVNDRWSFEIKKALLKDYPNYLSLPRSDNFGIMFLSKRKFGKEEIYEDGIPVIKAKFNNLTIISVHPLPPISKHYFKRRNEFLARIKNWTGDTKNLLICGDFNTVPWSPFFKSMCKENKVRSCSLGFGINNSWPTNLPVIRIPIDHCLISLNGFVKSFKRGPSVDSDHFPLIAEFGFKK